MIRLIIAIVFFWTAIIDCQTLDFFKERIEIEVAGDYCILTGKYYFIHSGKQDLVQTFYYPFIVNDSLPYPDKISIVNNKDNSPLKFSKQKNGILIQTIVSALDTLIYTVKYSQKSPYKMFEYILTTTKEWNKPIAEAEYILKLPKKYKLLFNSLGNISKTTEKGFTIYRLYKPDFMPDKNFKVKWGLK